MVPKTSQVSAARTSPRTDGIDGATSGDEDVSLVAADQRGQSRRQLRFWLLAGNVAAWILIIIAIRAFFF